MPAVEPFVDPLPPATDWEAAPWPELPHRNIPFCYSDAYISRARSTHTDRAQVDKQAASESIQSLRSAALVDPLSADGSGTTFMGSLIDDGATALDAEVDRCSDIAGESDASEMEVATPSSPRVVGFIANVETAKYHVALEVDPASTLAKSAVRCVVGEDVIYVLAACRARTSLPPNAYILSDSPPLGFGCCERARCFGGKRGFSK